MRKRIIAATIIALITPLIVCGALIAAFSIWASRVNVDEGLLPSSLSHPTFYDSDGEEIELSEDKYISPEEISDSLKYAFIATEDKRFYSHKGYDIKRIGGAIIDNIKAGGLKEGASTITQQLIKNTHLSPEKTFRRKLKELALAIDLESKYSKDEILSMYLSVIYFGKSAYGVRAAARRFFDKDISSLTLAECATLAGIVKNPAKYSPVDSPDASRERRNFVLKLMLDQGYISKTDYLNASNEQLITSEPAKGTSSYAAYIAMAKDEVMAILNMTKPELMSSDLRIYLNMRRPLQDNAARLNVECVSDNSVNSAAIVLGRDGRALAYASDIVYPIRRQAGSVLKPLAVYAPAFDMGLVSPSTPIIDERVNFSGYSPSNYNDVYYGATDIREAVKRSMNSVSLKVLDYVGIERSAEYLGRFGISTSPQDNSLALALGATYEGVSPLEIANAYRTLSNGGVYSPVHFVSYIVDGDKKVYSLPESPYSHNIDGNMLIDSDRVVGDGAASLMTHCLIETAKSGTAKTLSALPFEVAAKTGTAAKEDGTNTDGWCASYNDSCTVLVWHGSDALNEKGGSYPAKQTYEIWKYLAECMPMSKNISLSGVTQREIDTYSTSKNMRLTAATPLTPKRFRKSELFKIGCAPSADGSRFDINGAELKATNSGGYINLSFNAEEICAYELYRTDALGTRRIYSASDISGVVTLNDLPLDLGGRVEYTLYTRLIDNEGIFATSKREIFFDAYHFEHL